MWLLLKPRDFISGVKLAVGMLLGFAAVALVHPVIDAPFFEGAISHGKPIWPMLFVLVACGAISGFHAIVSTGTTARQLNNERDAKPIAFGGMLAEGALALLVIMVVAAGLNWGQAPQGLDSPGRQSVFRHRPEKGLDRGVRRGLRPPGGLSGHSRTDRRAGRAFGRGHGEKFYSHHPGTPEPGWPAFW